MPALILLNGPPASGKSTLADRLVALRPLALNLDIDVVRGQLGGWLERPGAAGRAARTLASAMASAHLASGCDVVVPQFLAKVDFIEELEHLASAAEAAVGGVTTECAPYRGRAGRHRRHARGRDPSVARPGALVVSGRGCRITSGVRPQT